MVPLPVTAAVTLLSSVVLVVVLGTASLLQPNDPLRQPVSDLAHGSAGPYVTAAFVVGGTGCVALALALNQAMNGRSTFWPTLMAIAGGLSVAMLAAVPDDPVGHNQSPIGLAHLLLSSAAFVLLAMALRGFSALAARLPSWKRASRLLDPLSWAVVVALPAYAIASAIGMLDHHLTTGNGIFERILIVALLAWILVASLQMLVARRPAEAQAVEPEPESAP